MSQKTNFQLILAPKSPNDAYWFQNISPQIENRKTFFQFHILSFMCSLCLIAPSSYLF